MSPSSPPARLVLRPGVHVLRRSATELQVGLHPWRAVILSDTGENRAMLRGLQRAEHVPATPPGAPPSAALRALESAGLVVDAEVAVPWCGAGPGAGKGAAPGGGQGGGMGVGDHAALALVNGDRARTALAGRAQCRVSIRPFGLPGGCDRDLAAMARRVGLGLAEKDGAPTVGAAVGIGEPERELLDDWIRDGIPHLLVRLHEGALTLGPFVVPGQSACLRCLDAHHTDTDPAWPLVVAQYARATGTGRTDGLAEPADAALTSLATGWAARDLCTYAEGDTPSTLGTTITLGPRIAALRTQAWRRHPACGCGWR